jgi:hypothetical protein
VSVSSLYDYLQRNTIHVEFWQKKLEDKNDDDDVVDDDKLSDDDESTKVNK